MIAIVCPQFYGVHGIARYLDSFLSNLPSNHEKIYLIIGDEYQVERHYQGVEFIHFPLRANRLSLFNWSISVRKLLIKLYEEGEIKWINLHVPPLIPGLFLPRHIPVILTAHTTYLGMSGKFYDLVHFKSQWNWLSLFIKSSMEHYILRNTSKVIALTEQGRQEVLRYGYKGDISVIPNGVDIQLFTPDLTIIKDIDVLFCGRIELRKGSRAMLELCKRLVSQKQDISICIVGYGEDENWVIEALAPFSKNIQMTGKVQFTEMIDYYKRSKLYVSTSYYEGLPGTCLEAMAMQLPVVVWDFLFYDRLVVNGENGWRVSPNDFDEMVSKALSTLSDPLLSDEMGRHGRNLLQEAYNWKNLAQNILNEF